MHQYIALIHPPDERSSWGVTFPDVPGCVAAGDSFEDASRNAVEALSAHLALLSLDGDAWPEARCFAVLRVDPQVQQEAEGAYWQAIFPRRVAAPRQRINIMMEPKLLRDADEFAEAQGMSRSSLIEKALASVMRESGKGANEIEEFTGIPARSVKTGAARRTTGTNSRSNKLPAKGRSSSR